MAVKVLVTYLTFCLYAGIAAAYPSCAALIYRIGGADILAQLSDIQLNQLNKKAPLEYRYPIGKPEQLTIAIIDNYIRLSEAERTKLIRETKQSKLITEQFVRQNLLLSLGDYGTWHEYFKSVVEEAGSIPVNHFSVSSFWGNKISQMPVAARMEIINAAKVFYDQARSSSDGHGSPKRELDYALHAALRGGEIIKDQLSAGKSPLQAYDIYLNTQNSLMQRTGTQRGNYSADVVFIALKSIQSQLTNMKTEGLIVGGSFTAGRANLKSSDIDFMTNSTDILNIETNFTKALQADLERAGIKTGLHLEHFPGSVGAPVDRSYHGDLASSNPVLFYVTAQKIEMWIYPTKLWVSGAPIESFMSDPVIINIQP